VLKRYSAFGRGASRALVQVVERMPPKGLGAIGGTRGTGAHEGAGYDGRVAAVWIRLLLALQVRRERALAAEAAPLALPEIRDVVVAKAYEIDLDAFVPVLTDLVCGRYAGFA
jgi:hypothetical protein